MTTTLKTADRFARLTLAVCVIIFYALGLITGPFALALVILSGLALLTFAVSLGYKWITID